MPAVIICGARVVAETLAQRIGRCPERQVVLDSDAENSYLVGDGL